ncbi:MAG: hypothetical protein K8T25_17440 [Planctomycetia bacterium]|nr:hypothetical protein [Planctomycetia bacterium]
MTEPPPKPKRCWFGLRTLFIVTTLIIVVAFAGCLYLAISTAKHAELALHATLLTFMVVEDHVKTHNGAWPRSWNELEKSPQRKWSQYEWPKDSKTIQQYVAVDFTADPKVLAHQSVDDFQAIKPIGSHFPYKDYGFLKSLLQTLREANGIKESDVEANDTPDK